MKRRDDTGGNGQNAREDCCKGRWNRMAVVGRAAATAASEGQTERKRVRTTKGMLLVEGLGKAVASRRRRREVECRPTDEWAIRSLARG
jgi:hypothetical protein